MWMSFIITKMSHISVNILFVLTLVTEVMNFDIFITQMYEIHSCSKTIILRILLVAYG